MSDLNENRNATDKAETKEQDMRAEAAIKLSQEFSGVKLFISELETQKKSTVMTPSLEIDDKAGPSAESEFKRSTKYPPEATTTAVGEEGLGPKSPEVTTTAVGEEGLGTKPPEATTSAAGEEGLATKPCPEWLGGSTRAPGEEGAAPKPDEWIGGSTKAVGEEGSAPKPDDWIGTTKMVGEEGCSPKPRR